MINTQPTFPSSLNPSVKIITSSRHENLFCKMKGLVLLLSYFSRVRFGGRRRRNQMGMCIDGRGIFLVDKQHLNKSYADLVVLLTEQFARI